MGRVNKKHVVFIPCNQLVATDYDYTFVKRASIFRMYNQRYFVFQDIPTVNPKGLSPNLVHALQ